MPLPEGGRGETDEWPQPGLMDWKIGGMKLQEFIYADKEKENDTNFNCRAGWMLSESLH